MHTSGLVVTLGDDPILAKGALAELAAAGPFELGESFGPCVAVVMDVADPKSAHDWHDWAASLPGVENVEVVFVQWDESDAEVTHAVA
ncbi:MAG: hypothetical protein K8T89_19110 [Planctomycetes bacterium]|nr:hypothetical protein [Planctomycetota bacterium]